LRQAGQDQAHGLIWRLFPNAAQPRPFLYRETGFNEWLVRSGEPPEPLLDGPVWAAIETKEDAPIFFVQQQLRFRLRLCARGSRPPAGDGPTRERGAKYDIATEARINGEQDTMTERVAQRMAQWLAERGARHGFAAQAESIVMAESQEIRVRGGQTSLRYTATDLHGLLAVTGPDLMLAAYHEGIGAQRAYGCGLLLLRPA